LNDAVFGSKANGALPCYGNEPPGTHSSVCDVIASYQNQIVGNGTVTTNGTLSEITAVDMELFI